MIKTGKSYTYWLALFNRKMSFHFPWVVPLISDRSVWYNGKQLLFPRSPLILDLFLIFPRPPSKTSDGKSLELKFREPKLSSERNPRDYTVHFPQEKPQEPTATKSYKTSGPVIPDTIRYQ